MEGALVELVLSDLAQAFVELGLLLLVQTHRVLVEPHACIGVCVRRSLQY